MSADVALLVIDVQMFIVEPDPIYRLDDLLDNIVSLITKAREANVPVLFVQHCGKAGEIDEPGSPGWQLHPAIAPTAGDVVIQKSDPDSFHGTTLKDDLDNMGIKRLIITGIQTEYCIDTTCRRAYSLGYDVTLVEDAHSTWDTDHLTASQTITHHNATLGGWFVTLKTAAQVAFNP